MKSFLLAIALLGAAAPVFAAEPSAACAAKRVSIESQAKGDAKKVAKEQAQLDAARVPSSEAQKPLMP